MGDAIVDPANLHCHKQCVVYKTAIRPHHDHDRVTRPQFPQPTTNTSAEHIKYASSSTGTFKPTFKARASASSENSALVLLDAIHVFDGLAILFHPGANDPVTTRVKTSIGCALTEARKTCWKTSSMWTAQQQPGLLDHVQESSDIVGLELYFSAYLATLVVLITVTGTWFGVIALRNGVERPPPFQR
ncbi:hypothetical protein CC1G_05553 [Coprinopsis cinerea okayama7|uniref:Uncharacterized protein n=1 Tax=Coprinopsis cinerea (strain Okayama-7 / 130 / ATCC MYA-4618 / FGSC 9003) TaxID=240176 RepID=A8P1D1_COPC7|nr:hypothetical protein CC1G_05553 [Coprinopsis cinerea okayama7\|eukprot:XP_001838072.2 hypothetical protein CC1G_05553 [Coprinopsis cinerea okayama7\